MTMTEDEFIELEVDRMREERYEDEERKRAIEKAEKELKAAENEKF